MSRLHDIRIRAELLNSSEVWRLGLVASSLRGLKSSGTKTYAKHCLQWYKFVDIAMGLN